MKDPASGQSLFPGDQSRSIQSHTQYRFRRQDISWPILSVT